MTVMFSASSPTGPSAAFPRVAGVAPGSSHPSSPAAPPTRRWRLARALGSLQMAVALLPTFAAVLALGTFVESEYDAGVAQQLVYQSWWFVALLGLLGLNIF